MSKDIFPVFVVPLLDWLLRRLLNLMWSPAERLVVTLAVSAPMRYSVVAAGLNGVSFSFFMYT